MTESKLCRTCGLAFPTEELLGHCPNCLFELVSHSARDSSLVGVVQARCGDYELFEELGRGGMGVVYRARQISLNRIVALKKLGASAAAFPSYAQRLRFEAEAAASLNHPNIVRVYEVDEYEGQPFFSMELIEGAGLNRRISPNGLSLETSMPWPFVKRCGPQAVVAALLIKITDAVHFAHKHGILHRDLKPANVVIDADGEPHLTDFGLAKILDQERKMESASGVIHGTAAYMAPEQAAGDSRRVSTAVDVYGLGAILYNLLTGQPPFRASTALETLRLVMDEQPLNPSAVNAAVDTDLASICLKCLEKEPDQRYPSAHALAEDLKRWLRHEPIEARPVGALSRLWRWCQREPKISGMLGGIFLLLAAVAVLVGTLFYNERRTRIESEQESGNRLKLLLRKIDSQDEQDQPLLRLSAEEVAVLTQRKLIVDGDEERVAMASRVPKGFPHQLILPYGEMIEYLQTHMRSDGGAPVLFDLLLYVGSANDKSDLLDGKAQSIRIDAATYVVARKRISDLVPIAQEALEGHPFVRGAIFVSSSLSITNLAGLKGRTFAFGDADSALGWYLPRAAMVEAGLRSSDLRSFTNTSRVRLIAAVRKGLYDAGVGLAEDVEGQIRAGAPLRIIHELISPADLWIVSTGLKPDIASALEDALLSLQDAAVLARLNPQLTGFSPAQSSDLDELERQIEKSKQFDQP